VPSPCDSESRRSPTSRGWRRLVREADGRVATGFLGTPLVLPALSDFGYFDEAYLMLQRREAPSWLYQVDRGATTVWERWDAIRADGSIHPGRMAPNPIDPDGREGHMLSFNHYAYGAVIDWVYRHLAGISPDRSRPGYRQIRFAPRPPAGIDHASAAIETAYGRASIAWNVAGSGMSVEIDVPFGTTALLDLPRTAESAVVIDGQSSASAPVSIGPGHHIAMITHPRLVEGRRAASDLPLSATADAQ